MKGSQESTHRVLSGAGKAKAGEVRKAEIVRPAKTKTSEAHKNAAARPAPRKIYPHATRPRPTKAQNAALERMHAAAGTPTDHEHICLLVKQCGAYGCPHVADTSTRGFTLDECPKYCQLKWEYEDIEKQRRAFAAEQREEGNAAAEAVKPRQLSYEELEVLRKLDECHVTAGRLFTLENLIRACKVDGCVHKVSSPSEIHSGVCICPGYCDIRDKAMPLLLMAR